MENKEVSIEQNKQEKKKENVFLNLALNVIIPSVILTKMSSDEYFGQVWALIIALAFPISYGVYDFINQKKLNFFSAFGLFSVLITGVIGLFSLNKNWMIFKETAIPAVMGLAVIFTQKTKYPLVRTILNQVLDFEKIALSYKDETCAAMLNKKIKSCAFMLSGTFFISAFLNFYLAKIILVGEPGSVEFNESLGKMTALSFPVISLPMMVMLGFIIFYLVKSIKEMTNLEFEEMVKQI